jgi:cytochrome c oxidase cbb3-type subunit III
MKRVVIIFVAAAFFISCEREERGFRVQTPDANRINSKQLTTLQAGERSPLPEFKNEYENNAFALSEGKRLFTQMNCSGCHANGGGAIGPALMDDKWIYGSQPDQIFATIVEGRPNGMPAFHGKLPDYEVWQIAAYVRSLSGNVPKDAAPGRNDDMQTKESENSTKRETPKGVAPPRPQQ